MTGDELEALVFFSICEISTHVHFGDPTSLIKMFFLVTNKPQVAAAC